MVFLAPLGAQRAGTRPPEITDWRVFHQNNDAYWARWSTVTSGLNPADRSKITISASDVRTIRLLAGISDDEPADPIVSLEARGMQIGQYLLVTSTPDGCLRAAVYGRGLHQYKELWSSDVLTSVGGICQLPGCPETRVSVDEKHRIIISTYSRSTRENPVCDQTTVATFVPKGNSFELQDRNTNNSKCWVGNGAGLSAALWKAAGPERTVAVVEVLPSLSPDRYALALQHDATGAHVLRLNWREPGSPFMGAQSKATASDCFFQASSIHVKVSTSKVPQDRAEELVAALGRIDLRADRCVRNAERECAMFTDGTYFHVEAQGHAAIDIFDLRGEKGYMSENPELSEWIYKLIDAVEHPKKPAIN